MLKTDDSYKSGSHCGFTEDFEKPQKNFIVKPA